MESPPGEAAHTDYLRHFGFREPPFSVTPDPAYLFACRSIREALKRVLVAVVNGEGLIKLTGEVGTGKTLLCRKLLATLDGRWRAIYVANPAFDPRTLYLALAEGLGVAVDPGVDHHQLQKAITRGLLDCARKGKRVVLVVDEGQVMPAETLEALRLITNLETEKRKLLQVVLVGQPELDSRLALPALRQVLQRISFQHHMGTLEADEVAAYVAHRMAVAGVGRSAPLAESDAQRLHRMSGGIPRLVNVLMHKALQLACAEGVRVVERRHLEAAAADTPAVSSLEETFMASAHEPAAAPSLDGGAVEKMLAELERREASPPSDASTSRALRGSSPGHEWFWRTVAGLLAMAIAWVGWVAYKLQPVEGLATELAYRAAEQARQRQATGVIGPSAARAPGPVPVEVPTSASNPETEEQAATAAKEARYTLRMEHSIFTAIPERAAAQRTADPAAR